MTRGSSTRAITAPLASAERAPLGSVVAALMRKAAPRFDSAGVHQEEGETMAVAHFKRFFDSEYAGVWDLEGRDRIVTIARVQGGQVGGHQGKAKSKKLLLQVRELDKPIVCNVTNAKAIASMHGPDVSQWPGKRITLYPTTTSFGGQTVDCIRVRPTAPRGEPEHIGGRPVDREVRDRQERAAQAAEPHPAAPIRDATTADELVDAIRACAAWIDGDMGARWPRVLTRAEQLGLSDEHARLTFDVAIEALSPSAKAAQ
jgi:hypothetical protein